MRAAWMILSFIAAASAARMVARDSPRTSLNYPVNYFDQPIDHYPKSDRYRPHTTATFKQRYYVDYSYYKPGGPVFLYIGGETSGPNRFSNMQTGIIQILMEATNGLGVILENRYYGQSYPFNTSTTDQLAYLTNEQTIADNAYFAQHVVFPNITADLAAPSTPWILYGGSLAGVQTAFSIKAHGDVLYAGIASSAPINVTVGYPLFHEALLKFAPQDCISRVSKIVDNFDLLLSRKEKAAVNKFKAIFGLESLTDDRDFAQAISNPMGNPGFYYLNTWQELGWTADSGSRDFFYFCGNVTNLDTPEDIAQVDYAMAEYTNGEPWVGLGAYADYIKNNLLPQCLDGDYNSNDCFGTQNASWWADVTNSGSRSYIYTSCIEAGIYIDAPKTGPALMSRVIDTSYEQQWCEWAFPRGRYNAVPPTPDLERWNGYGAFNFSADRLAFIDGDQDVFNDLCYHSPYAPLRAPQSDLHPEYFITGAGHHWDSYGILDVEAEPQFIREAHLWEIRTVKRWLQAFDDWKASKKSQP